MSGHWTAEQKEAIYTRDGNLLVAAAAGAGKTAVLVERVVRLLLDPANPVDIDRLLVVTFTEAAASEMRERIGRALEEAMEREPGDNLARQLALLHGAAISTIHSFCLDVVRRYFYRLDMEPSFRVAEPPESDLLQQEVVAELLEDCHNDSTRTVFQQLVWAYGGRRGDEGLARLILSVYLFTRSTINPGKWLKEAVEPFASAGDGGEPALARWLEPVRRHLGHELQRAKDLLQSALRLCRLPGVPPAYRPVLENDLSSLEELLGLLGRPLDEIRQAWLDFGFDRLPAVRGVGEAVKEQVKERRDAAKAAVKRAGEIFLTRDSGSYREEIRQLAPLVQELALLVEEFSRRFAGEKRQRGLLDFSDLEHLCLQVLLDGQQDQAGLRPSAEALAIRDSYDYVLVDEYQDINPVQDAILNLVSRQGADNPNLFMVGDVKQSIYRFRLADPGIFLARYRTFPEEPGGRERKICLSSNFRCAANIVEAVNYLFRRLMTGGVAGMVYDSKAELVYGAGYDAKDDPVEVHLVDGGREALWTGEGADAEADEEAELTLLEREAMVIARRIMEMTAGGCEVCLPGGKRPVRYSDIAVLLRATTGRANHLVEVLRKAGIPADADLATGYFQAVEVQTMLSLLSVVDNPCQDIPLAAVLRSPLVGLDEGELAAVRLAGGKGGFYECVSFAAAGDIPGVSARLREFLDRLDRWRSLARRDTLSAFIDTVYRESGYLAYVGGLPDGAHRRANLEALVERAGEFDRFSKQGLFRFLRYMGFLQRFGRDLGAARSQGSGKDAVTVLSIHKAKGLEFPVVFVCDLGRKFNFQEMRGEVLVHRELGFGPLVVDRERRRRYPSLPHLACRLSGEAEARAEELRILYVALTRARQKLILLASAPDLERRLSDWQEAAAGGWPPDYRLARAQSFLDWLGPVLSAHPDWPGNRRAGDPECSRWSVSIWRGGESVAPVGREAAEPVTGAARLLRLLPLQQETDPELAGEVRARITYRYPYLSLATVPAKVAAAAAGNLIYGRREDQEAALFEAPSWPRPAFLQGAGQAGVAWRGHAHHLVMQHLDLGQSLDAAGVKKQVELLVQKKLVGAELAELVDFGAVAAFFATEVGRLAVGNRKNVLREWHFTMALPAAELFDPEGAPEEEVVVQGVADLVVRERDCFYVVDYKTGKPPLPGEKGDTLHRLQLSLYARAVQGILQPPTVKAYLYYLDSCLLVPVETGKILNFEKNQKIGLFPVGITADRGEN